jgi:hypothetical protein
MKRPSHFLAHTIFHTSTFCAQNVLSQEAYLDGPGLVSRPILLPSFHWHSMHHPSPRLEYVSILRTLKTQTSWEHSFLRLRFWFRKPYRPFVLRIVASGRAIGAVLRKMRVEPPRQRCICDSCSAREMGWMDMVATCPGVDHKTLQSWVKNIEPTSWYTKLASKMAPKN